jgi:DNA (cytosine-5)-methyltransferase 3A
LNVLSLFDGMSCGRIALDELGIEVNSYFASEVNKYAIKIAKKNYPNTIQLGDINNLDENTLKQLPKINLLIGGSPCQNLSISTVDRIKHNQGLEGQKSKLFYEYVRVLEWVKQNNNPNVKFLLENVGSMRDEDKEIITKAMEVEPIHLDSANFSAQNRERYYWTNLEVSEDVPTNKDVLQDIILSPKEVEQQETGRMKVWYDEDFEYIDSEGNVEALLDINGHDILKRVYKKDHKCATLTTCGGGNTQKKIIQEGRVRKLLPIEYERLQTVPDNYTKGVSNTRRYNMLGNGWTVEVIKFILKNLKEE